MSGRKSVVVEFNVQVDPVGSDSKRWPVHSTSKSPPRAKESLIRGHGVLLALEGMLFLLLSCRMLTLLLSGPGQFPRLLRKDPVHAVL